MSRLKLWLKNNIWGISIGAYLGISLICGLAPEIDTWVSAWYACDYSMGIGSRMFIGTILSLFYDDFLDKRLAFAFVVLTILLIVILVSCYFNKLILANRQSISVIYMVILFLAMPGSITSIWNYGNLGRLELYGILLALLSILIFSKIRNTVIKYIIVTFFSVVSIAIYHGNVFMYYPIVLMLFVDDGLMNYSSDIKTRRILGGLSVFVTALTFLFFQFVKNVNYKSVTEMVEVLRNKTDLYIAEEALEFELFQPIWEAYKHTTVDFILYNHPREKAALTLILVLPIILLICCIYYKCHKCRIYEQKKILECPYAYYIAFGTMIIPQYILNVDWGRWMISSSIVWFTGIFYLIYKKDKYMMKVMDEFSQWIQKNIFVSLLFLIYIAEIGEFVGKPFINEVNNLWNWIYYIFNG